MRDTVSRIEVTGDSAWRHVRDIDQARVFANYDRGARSLRLRAGRFKAPVSFIGLESKWSLPSVERGLLSELEVDGRDLPFAGFRGDGVSLEVRPRAPLRPRLTLAAFQNPSATSEAAAPLDASQDLTQDVFGRVDVEPVDGVRVAASPSASAQPSPDTGDSRSRSPSDGQRDLVPRWPMAPSCASSWVRGSPRRSTETPRPVTVTRLDPVVRVPHALSASTPAAPGGRRTRTTSTR